MDYRENKKRRGRENKARALKLLGGVCVTCGSTDRLEFDHKQRDRGYKPTLLISQLIYGRWERLEKELAKCQLMCKSCHTLKSHIERGHWGSAVHGTASMYSNQKCRCGKCRKAWSLYNRRRYLERQRLKGLRELIDLIG